MDWGGPISAGLNLGSQIAANVTAKKQQKRQQAHEISMWNLQNEYNSPQAQMKRFQEAGLNPNMIYGQSSGGASGVASSAPQTVGLDEAGYRPIDFGGVAQGLSLFTDYNKNVLTNDNLKAQNSAIQAKTLLDIEKRSTEKLNQGLKGKELAGWQELRDANLDNLNEVNRLTQAQTERTIDSNKREELLNSVRVSDYIKRWSVMDKDMSLTDAQIQRLNQDYRIKQLDEILADKMLTTSDPYLVRLAVGMVDAAAEAVKEEKNPQPPTRRSFNSAPLVGPAAAALNLAYDALMEYMGKKKTVNNPKLNEYEWKNRLKKYGGIESFENDQSNNY